jgi:hypothetical protein
LMIESVRSMAMSLPLEDVTMAKAARLIAAPRHPGKVRPPNAAEA